MGSLRRAAAINTIDLRRQSERNSTEEPAAGRRLYGTILVVAAVCAVASAMIELTLSFSAAVLPVGGLSFRNGDEDTPPAWRALDVIPAATVLRDGDLIVEADGVPALEILRSDSIRYALDRTLRGGPVSFTIVREPVLTGRPFTAWRVLGMGGTSSGIQTRSVVLDSARAGQGLEATLRGLDSSDPDVCGAPEPPCLDDREVLGRIPPTMDLQAAEAALVSFDRGMERLPAGTEVRLGLRGDDLAMPLIALTSPTGTTVQLEETAERWLAIPAGTSTQRIELVRRRWSDSVLSMSARLIVLLVAVVGLLSLRARSTSQAIGHFVALCTLVSIGALPALFDSWARLRSPISPQLTFGDQYFAYRLADGAWTSSSVLLVGPTLTILATATLAAALILYSGLRLLHTFPSRDPRLESQYGVPWRTLLGTAVLGIVAAVVLGRAARPDPLLWGLRLGFGGVIALLFSMLVMLIQIVRLGVARMRQPHHGEEALQARLALSGLALGSIVLLVIWAFPSWYRASLPWTVGLYDAVQGTRTALTPTAIAIPFLGFFLAIATRGLWDVDLIIQRATVYSTLTVLFVIAWLLLETSVEALLADSLAGVPVVGGLAPALLAGGLVAASQKSVTNFLAQRLRPAGAPFGDVVEELAEQLEEVRDALALPAFFVARMRELAASSHCTLFLRGQDDSVWRRWSAGAASASSVIVAAALDALESARHVVVMVDEGPTLVTKVDRTERPQAILLMGMRPGSAFYSAEDRQLLTLFLGTLAPRLTL